MKAAFYRFMIDSSRRLGLWVFRFFTWWITAGHFLFFPGRVAVGVRFYGAVFPERGRWYHLWCTWRQYHRFSHVFLDRIFLSDDITLTHTHEGWEYLEDAVNRQTGGIVLMSHVGSWEIASHLLKARGSQNPRMKLLLYLGQKHKEQIERIQKESLIRSGVRIIAVEQEGGSPADLLEGIKFLKNGGLVSLTGDRLWREDQRSIPVKFFGHEAFIPETPFIFALLSGAPLLIFFTYRSERQTYHIKTLPPEYVRVKDRSQRAEAIKKAAQSYADHLEETVRQHPWEWFHFEPFIGRKIQPPQA